MATQHRQQPSRLHIPPFLNAQLANSVDPRTMYSPALATASQASFPIPFNGNMHMQTPMQASFFQNAQGRPPHLGHRPGSASVAHFPPHGMHGANVPMTPLGQAGFPQAMTGGHPGHGNAPFIPRSRRTPSMIGGPPKALLGGPNRKPSPLPPAQQVIQEKLKAKKVLVKIPKESQVEEADENGASSSKSLWSRTPATPSTSLNEVEIVVPETISGNVYPEESLTRFLPPTVDVFLPGKSAWDAIRERMLEEKLEQLGIESHSDFAPGIPEIHAPRARAASISSPADPALLFFKLNKLQQSQQTASFNNSLTTSPNPASASISPNPQAALRLQRHGPSMSLVHPPVYHQQMFESPMYETGGRVAHEGDFKESDVNETSPIAILAPQGRVPAQLSVPSAPSRTDSRPDFIRGFGLDITEEEEEGEEEDASAAEPIVQEPCSAEVQVQDAVEDTSTVDEGMTMTEETAPAHGVHTRQASRISVTLSVGSPTKLEHKGVDDIKDSEERLGQYKKDTDDVDDAVNEWTGSEDMRSEVEISDDESVGEWSNPSDEERARQDRLHRRLLHRMQAQEAVQPRRIPNFPKPPEESQIRDNEDIISNPSEEDNQPLAILYHSRRNTETHVFARPSSNNSMGGRPLPPLPHSRDGSSHMSYHGSLPSHSRAASEHFAGYGESHHAPSGSISSRRDSLNPFAKPFVFGSRPTAPPQPQPQPQPVEVASPALGSAPSHSRLPSLHRLNAAAQEFRPGGFTFRPPEGIKPLAFPEPAQAPPEVLRPLPQVPAIGVSHASQGREKRRKVDDVDDDDGFSTTDDDYDDEDKENRDTMSSFRFPPAPEPTMVFHRSAPTSPNRLAAGALNASAKPFTFSGFPSSSQNPVQSMQESNAQSYDSDSSEPRSPLERYGGDAGNSTDLSMPQNQRQKRAPIPLDFKHPVSTNTVPAGLFKSRSHMDMEDRARPPRARVSSLEFSDQRSELSLDDLSVPAISHKAIRARVAAQEAAVTESPPPDFNDASCPASGRTSRMSGDIETTVSESRISRHSNLPPVPPDMEAFGEGLRFEQRLEALLDRKLDMMQETLMNGAPSHEVRIISTQTEELVKEAMAMFRSQLRDSVVQNLDDSRMDARGEIDFDLIRGVVEQAQEETRSRLQRDIAEFFETVEHTTRHAASESAAELSRHIQDVKANVIVSNAHLTEKLNAIEASSPYSGSGQEREALVYDLLNALTPQILSLRTEPLDYDGLTLQLSQAVKPHIHQLIDLASDKQETAELIANRLMPILQSLASSPAIIDTENLISEITATVNRIIAPFDTHSIKEQVADLVVERLDSRLAVRDNSLNLDGLSTAIVGTLAPVSEQVAGVTQRLDSLLSEHRDSMSRMKTDVEDREKARSSDVETLDSRMQSIADNVSKVHASVTEQRDLLSALDRISVIETSLATITSAQTSAGAKDDALLSSHQLLDLQTESKELLSSLAQSLETKHAEVQSLLASGRDSSQEMAKLTNANADLQIQVVKARSAHGTIRVEKDNLAQKLRFTEKDRDEFRMKFEELQSLSLSKASEQAVLEARLAEQERAMKSTLERLTNADISSQSQNDRIAELEKANRELSLEKQQLKGKVMFIFMLNAILLLIDK
ncbi:hypothetical protein SCHPADRAFT_479122 [Schizopora paradoxa]|uniref:Uncharacterized protein n=1 Tax=Schizopora paradoxa TaxID=27342 RepID=A0A0H2RI15_9AGAM|nr:hypothetical protein SCHPADRAFT_479122 [Schizopora paradoxa]